MCFSLSASGQMADLCVVIGGLTSDELPMSENELRASRGIRIIEVSGLTPGCTLNPQSKEYGYLILCRGSIAGVDTARHEWYDKNVFFRFIKNLKEEKIEVTNEEVPIMRSWRDGDFSQINALPMCYIKKRWDDDKIAYNKQSANRSGTEQSADLYGKNLDRHNHHFKPFRPVWDRKQISQSHEATQCNDGKRLLDSKGFEGLSSSYHFHFP